MICCDGGWVSAEPRLRAAVFVNLVAMRKCMATRNNEVKQLMSTEDLKVLERANFLYHCAHNSILAD